MLGRLFAWGGAAAPAAPSGPSTDTVTAMQFVAGARGSLRLLVLTTAALDCWQVLSSFISPPNTEGVQTEGGAKMLWPKLQLNEH